MTTMTAAAKKREDDLQLVNFRVGGDEFSIDILNVQEIIRMPEITRVPKSPEFVEGMINLRGRIVPILDLSRRLGIERKGFNVSGDSRILITSLGKLSFGILVDSVSEVFHINRNLIEPPSDVFEGDKCVSGVIKMDDRLILLLDLAKLFSQEELGAIHSEVFKQEVLADGRVLVTKKEWGMGGEYIKKEIIDGAKDIVNQKGKNGWDEKLVKSVIEDVGEFIESFGAHDMAKAQAALERIIQRVDKRLFDEVGKIARNLHNSIQDVRNIIDPKIKQMAINDMPDAKDRLGQVVTMTENAANKTLEMVEQGALLNKELKKQVEQFREALKGLEKVKNKKVEAFFQDTEKRLNEILDSADGIGRSFIEITEAQSFQDLTGQTIKKVMPVVEEVEKSLLHLVQTFGVEIHGHSPAKPTEDTKLHSQQDVDSMLAQFGF